MRRMGLKTKPIENYDYRFIEFHHATHNQVYVEILSGKFDGAVYNYDMVKVIEDKELGLAKLSFHFEMLFRTELQDNTEFHHYAGEVLASILSEPDSHIGKLNVNG